MNIRYNGNEIQLTEDGNYRPDRLIINGEEASMTLFYEKHGYNWKSSASGNDLCYRTQSGREYLIPQARLQNTFQDELREAIKDSGKNMREVSELLEIPYRTIQDWRAGRRIPGAYVRKDIIEKIRGLEVE
ncbi:MAG: hypothetical protein ACI4RU_06700 [Acutalibacteraceae bacterium]